MSENPAMGGGGRTAAVPEWDVADRMRKAMRTADVGVQEMADYLGVGRNTVSTWINGRITPSRQTLMLWSLRCGVPYEWVADGELPRLDLNQQPCGYQLFGPDSTNVVDLSVFRDRRRSKSPGRRRRTDDYRPGTRPNLPRPLSLSVVAL